MGAERGGHNDAQAVGGKETESHRGKAADVRRCWIIVANRYLWRALPRPQGEDTFEPTYAANSPLTGNDLKKIIPRALKAIEVSVDFCQF